MLRYFDMEQSLILENIYHKTFWQKKWVTNLIVHKSPYKHTHHISIDSLSYFLYNHTCVACLRWVLDIPSELTYRWLSANALELLQSCTKPLICVVYIPVTVTEVVKCTLRVEFNGSNERLYQHNGAWTKYMTMRHMNRWIYIDGIDI